MEAAAIVVNTEGTNAYFPYLLQGHTLTDASTTDTIRAAGGSPAH